MAFQVIIPKSVEKELNRLPDKVTSRTLDAFTELQVNPRPIGCKKLVGRDAWRVRVGNYRIIYEIDDHKKNVTIFSIRHRREAYRK